jgi:hypothetical protein
MTLAKYRDLATRGSDAFQAIRNRGPHHPRHIEARQWLLLLRIHGRLRA